MNRIVVLLFALCLGCAVVSHAQVTVVGSFNGANGWFPTGTLVLSGDGTTLYGTTASIAGPGGIAAVGGTVFSVPVGGGSPTVLASFNVDEATGENSTGGLTLSADGSTLYGVTPERVFSVPVGGGTITTLATFSGGAVSIPQGSLTLSVDGSTLYGTSEYGGTSGGGTVFSVPVGGGTITTLATFDDPATDGYYPQAGLALIGSTLYGTTSSGGDNLTSGTVFSVPVGGGTITTLASFDAANGGAPYSSLKVSADGTTFYGTSQGGGTDGQGTVFSVPVGGGVITTLANFGGGTGAFPFGNPTLNSDGTTLYGTLNEGGGDDGNSFGTVFSVPVGGGTPTVLALLNGTTGDHPYGGVTFSADGRTLYGTASTAGPQHDGTVFSLAISNVATLSTLKVSTGTLSPVFSNAALTYAVTVSNATTSLTVTPTVTAGSNATVTVAGNAVVSGSASGPVALSVGVNPIAVVVTAQDGVTTKTYTLNVTRQTTPTVVTLAQTGLSATAATLNGTVEANGASTTVSFNYGLSNTYGQTVAATPANVTGSSVTAVSAKLTGLKPLTTYHYQVKGVNVAGPSTGADMQFTTPNNVATLSGLVLSSGPLTPVFKNTTLSYTATVSNPTPAVMLTPTTTDPNATVTVNGATTLSGSASAPLNLNAGSNTISVVVTAQDGVTKKTYTVKVTRTALLATMSTLPATNVGTTTATLNGTAVANNANTTLTFDYGTSTAYGKTIAATPSSVNGTTSTSISATPAGLVPGTTYHFRAQGVNVAGTANGADMTFTTIDNAAKLSGLKLSNGTLSPAFSSGTKVYAATVANAITSITVTPTVPAASHATVTVNGVTVASGSASGAISLAPGPNTITLVVTAQDGVTTGTYTVNVTRTTPVPVVVTQPATSVGSTGAILNATVNASNTSTTPTFQYGLTTSYGSSMAATPSPLTGSTVTPVSATVSGLLPAKTYHYRVSAINVGGTSNGLDATFTTPNNVATLSKLVLSTGAMDQSFSPATTSYTQTVSSSTTSLTVTPTITANSKATVTVNSNAVASGKPSTVAVTTGSNTINVVVTAQNGTTTNTYTITVTVPAVPAVVPANSQTVPALTGGALVPIKAQLTGPVANGGVLPGATVTFTWNAGRSVSAYRLSIGTTEGATDLYDGVEGLALTHTVTLPTTGADLYVTLRSMINGTWLANNYLFSAADTTIKAVLLTPADQSVLTAATQTFTWGAVPTAQAYWLSIGSTEGGADLYNASQGTALTQNVTLPTDGRELFVALQTSLNGQWVASNSTLTAAGTGAPVTAQLTSPADQSVLLGSPVTFTWEAGAGVSEYWLSLGSTPSATDLYTAGQGTNQSVTIAVPTDGSPLYLTLSSLVNGQWHSNQYLLQAAIPP